MGRQLLLSYDFPPMSGGIARWMGELAKRYTRGSLIVSTGRHPGDSAVDRKFPNRVDRLPMPGNRLRTLAGIVRWSRRVAELALEAEAEFIWGGNIKPAAYPARWTRLRIGVPYGLLLHGGDLLILRGQIQRSLLKRRTARALLGSASVLVSNSTWTESLCRRVLEELGIDARHCSIQRVALGADPLVFRPGLDQRQVRRRYHLRDGRWLLSVARLTRHKGLDLGIRAVAQLANEYPDLAYAIVGSGEELPALERLARALGVADRVRFLLQVPDEDLPALYNCAELYLGLSRYLPERVEGFGIALVEASASGVPVLAGKSGGIADAVQDGETGVLVNPENVDEICAAIRRLLDDRSLSIRLGAAGRKAVETYYNWDRVTADLARIGQEHGRAPHLEGVR
jgi:phosphatidylinositol alpha-1,6-mannosyltransferase